MEQMPPVLKQMFQRRLHKPAVWKQNRTDQVVAPAGATAISIVKPMKDARNFNGTEIEYEVVPTTDLIVARLTAKEADFAVIVNLAAQLYQKKLPYKLASVVTWGNLYIASSKTWKDGKI